jgi:transcription antitermination factor NusA-like protein
MQMTQKGAILAIMPVSMSQVEFEGTKGVIRIRKSMTETTQLPKEKGQNDETIYEILHRKLKIKQHSTKN